MTRVTVLKGCSMGKVENLCSGRFCLLFTIEGKGGLKKKILLSVKSYGRTPEDVMGLWERIM